MEKQNNSCLGTTFSVNAFIKPETQEEFEALLDEAHRLADELGEQLCQLEINLSSRNQ